MSSIVGSMDTDPYYNTNLHDKTHQQAMGYSTIDPIRIFCTKMRLTIRCNMIILSTRLNTVVHYSPYNGGLIRYVNSLIIISCIVLLSIRIYFTFIFLSYDFSWLCTTYYMHYI